MQSLGKKLAAQLVVNQKLRTEIQSILDGNYCSDISSPIRRRAVIAQNMLSLWAEVISDHPKMGRFTREIKEKEEEYMPGYPPMSPITQSFFSLWLVCDYRLASGETIASLFPFFAARLRLSEQIVSDCLILGKSRMGFYKIIEALGTRVKAAEIPTGRAVEFETATDCPAGIGEIRFVRLFEPGPTQVEITTPYIIAQGITEADLVNFFQRQKVKHDRLALFTKRPPEIYYWHEYIFNGYIGHTKEAIFLAGIPDIPETLPHSPSYTERVNAH